MKIENAKYFKIPDETMNGVTKTYPVSSITCIIDGQYWGVPIEVGNVHYDEIKRQLDAGLITIEAAD